MKFNYLRIFNAVDLLPEILKTKGARKKIALELNKICGMERYYCTTNGNDAIKPSGGVMLVLQSLLNSFVVNVFCVQRFA
jgi:hypothetical protein